MTDIITDNDDDELTPTQEYTIAGGVILLFGLLYWFLNHGWNADMDSVAVSTPTVSAQLAPSPAPVQVAANLDVSSKAPPPAQPLLEEKLANADVAPSVAVPATDSSAAPPPAPEPAPAIQNAAAQDAGPVGPASPKAEAATVAQSQAYKLPDGSEIAVGSSGFDAELLQILAKGEMNKPVIFDKIMFDKGSARINASSNEQIKVAAALLHHYPNIKLLIRGHTDETGMSSSNTELSLIRANQVGVELVNLGIDRTRLRIMGMGDSNPIDTNATEEGRSKNRRVDAMIIQ